MIEEESFELLVKKIRFDEQAYRIWRGKVSSYKSVARAFERNDLFVSLLTDVICEPTSETMGLECRSRVE